MTRKKEKFINSYETKIKEIRKEYYRNITKYSNNEIDRYIIELILKVLPGFLGILLLFTSKYDIKTVIFVIVLSIVLSVLIDFYFDKKGLESSNKYLKEIRKLGYFTIEDYEHKLKEYVTGEEGEYSKLQAQLIKKYNITQDTDVIEDLGGNRYYLWFDNVSSKIYILDTKLNTKPEVETFRLSDIRYFRLDRKRNLTVLKTDTEEKYFNKKTYDTLSKYIKSKQFENLKIYEPEENINDFERYMHKIKKEIDKDIDYDQDKKNVYISNIIILIIILCGFSILLKLKFEENLYMIIKLAMLVEVGILNFNLVEYLQYKPMQRKTEKEYINLINSNEECISRFNELKISLGIPSNADKVYTKEGAEYLTWTANGYFHVFLNVIYFNSVYMVVKLKDVMYYQGNKKECIVKLKDKELQFEPEAKIIFDKILPNKDLNWINGLQK